MSWIVKITDEPNKRINVSIDPLKDGVYFRGEYKPHNCDWITFSEICISLLSNLDLEIIQTKISEAYDLLIQRLDAYNNLVDGFKIIKEIEIKKD